MGGTEILIALIIILLIFGAKWLSDLGKSLGIGVKELPKEAAGLGGQEKAQRGPRNTDAKGKIAPGKEEHSLRAP